MENHLTEATRQGSSRQGSRQGVRQGVRQGNLRLSTHVDVDDEDKEGESYAVYSFQSSEIITHVHEILHTV